LLLLAGALAVGVLGYAYVLEPLLERHREVSELIAARQELLARQRRLVAREERYQQEQHALDAEIAALRGRLLPGDKAPLGASELQKLVKSTAQDSGVEVRSERILPTAERGGYVEVPVEVTLSGPIRAVVSFVYRLEAASVFLTMTDLKLRVVSIAAPRDLSVTVSLIGYIAAAPANGGRPGATEPGRRPGA
jgi:Tfp pilus assembly protein PilO